MNKPWLVAKRQMKVCVLKATHHEPWEHHGTSSCNFSCLIWSWSLMSNFLYSRCAPKKASYHQLRCLCGLYNWPRLGVGIMTRKWIGPLDHACLPRGDPPLNMRRLWQELLVATLPPTPLDMQGNHIYSCHEYVNLNYRFMQYR